jgi:hypothetical protein
MFLRKYVIEKDRHLNVLKAQNVEMSEELEVMAKTDDLIRNRLDKKQNTEKAIRRS